MSLVAVVLPATGYGANYPVENLRIGHHVLFLTLARYDSFHLEGALEVLLKPPQPIEGPDGGIVVAVHKGTKLPPVVVVHARIGSASPKTDGDKMLGDASLPQLCGIAGAAQREVELANRIRRPLRVFARNFHI